MPPEVAARARELLMRRFSVPPLTDYITEVSPHLPPPRHVAHLCRVLEQARIYKRKLCLSWPPRHAKTTTLLHGFGWWLRHQPADTCGYFTYSDRQGRSKSRIARRIAEQGGVELDVRSNDMSEWRTRNGGGLLAGGAGGGLTGQGISGLFVVDDPYKSRVEADSIHFRERVWDWFREVVLTRDEGASIVVVHTRWHPDDLIGRIASDPDFADFEQLNIPAIAEPDDIMGRTPGEALWPERFPIEDLRDKLAKLGEWSFAALYQGRPRPRGGQLFRGETLYGQFPDLQDSRIFIVCDPAATAKSVADYSAIVVAAAKLLPNGLPQFDILDMHRLQVEIPVLVEFLRETQQKWQAPVWVEAVGGFKAVPQMLRAVSKLKINELHPVGDKFTRAQPAAAAWNDGRIRLPAVAPWKAEFLPEIHAFTGVNDPHDDQVDVIAHLVNVVNESLKRTRRRVVQARGLPFG